MMKDTEILQALEICSSTTGCEGCPYHTAEDDISCSDQICKDAIELIKKQKGDIENLQNLRKLDEADIADRDKMLKEKVEVVYADFMRDYECIKEENEGLYEENAEQRAEIERLRKELALKENALLSVTYIAKRIPQTICDHCHPDFNRNDLPVNVWESKEGYAAVDALVDQIVKEAATQ